MLELVDQTRRLQGERCDLGDAVGDALLLRGELARATAMRGALQSDERGTAAQSEIHDGADPVVVIERRHQRVELAVEPA